MTDLYLGYPSDDETTWIKKYAAPFYIEALENGHIKIIKTSETSSPVLSLLYSFDNKTWQDWDYVTGTDVITGQKFYIKAKTENKTFCGTNTRANYNYFSLTSKVNVAGNIMSLLYNDFASKIALTENFCFSKLFNKQTYLIDASNLILPATTLSENCYRLMFYNCSSLIAAPKLPAVKLTRSCYNSMFYYCLSLVSAPKLQAIKLSDICYYYMFDNCVSITELHYPKSIQDNMTFTSMYGSPWFGATNATIYFDL